MDGWETRRRRTPGHDWCIVRLGLRGRLRGVDVDTNHFIGNFPESCSLEACDLPADARRRDAAARRLDRGPAEAALAGQPAQPVPDRERAPFTHLRLNIYPDGGVARLRVHGEVALGLAAAAPASSSTSPRSDNGGVVLAVSDVFFGAKENLLMPGRAPNMGDGWETRRRRGPGHDWAIVRLGDRGRLERDRGRHQPLQGQLPGQLPARGLPVARRLAQRAPRKARRLGGAPAADQAQRPQAPLLREAGRARAVQPRAPQHLSRRRRQPAEGPWTRCQHLDAMPEAEARAAFLRCCGSPRWAAAMAAGRPFASAAALLAAAEADWSALGREDWLEAFGHHPRIGDRDALRARLPRRAPGPPRSRRGAAQPTTRCSRRSPQANRGYEARFGYIFIVCATGKSAEEMLARLEARLGNDAGAGADDRRRGTGEDHASSGSRSCSRR